MAFEDKFLRTQSLFSYFELLDCGFPFTVTPLHRNVFSLMSFQKDSYNAIERLTIECRKTKTKIITLANHSKHKQRQSDHAENTCDKVTILNNRERFASYQTSDIV